jgi:hypothetical protein
MLDAHVFFAVVAGCAHRFWCHLSNLECLVRKEEKGAVGRVEKLWRVILFEGPGQGLHWQSFRPSTDYSFQRPCAVSGWHMRVYCGE